MSTRSPLWLIQIEQVEAVVTREVPREVPEGAVPAVFCMDPVSRCSCVPLRSRAGGRAGLRTPSWPSWAPSWSSCTQSWPSWAPSWPSWAPRSPPGLRARPPGLRDMLWAATPPPSSLVCSSRYSQPSPAATWPRALTETVCSLLRVTVFFPPWKWSVMDSQVQPHWAHPFHSFRVIISKGPPQRQACYAFPPNYPQHHRTYNPG